MNSRYSVVMLLILLLIPLLVACSSSDGDNSSSSDGDSDKAAEIDISDSDETDADSDSSETSPDGDRSSDGDAVEEESEDSPDGDLEEENVEADGDDSEMESEPETEPEAEDEPETEDQESEISEDGETDGDLEPEEDAEAEAEPEEETPLPWFVPTAAEGLLVVNYNGVDENSLSVIDIFDGSLVQEAFVGNLSDLSPAADLSLELSIPSYPLPGNLMGVLDRAGATYTAFESGGGYSAWQRNLIYDLAPQDLLVLSDGRAYVSRYATNPDDNTGVEWDSGDDIYIISWPEASALGAIELTGYASNIGGVQCKAHPRRMAAAWNLIWVVLENTSADGTKWGDGKVVAIDPATDSVVYTHTVTGRHNCTDLAYMQEIDQLAVVCGGNPGDASPKTYSGVFGFSWDGSALSSGFIKPAEFISIGPLGSRLAVYNEWVFVVVKPLSGASSGETVWGVNGSNLGTISVYQTPQNGLVNSLAVEPVCGRLYFTDSSAKAVRQADLTHFPFEELGDQKIVTDSVGNRPPVEIGLY